MGHKDLSDGHTRLFVTCNRLGRCFSALPETAVLAMISLALPIALQGTNVGCIFKLIPPKTLNP